MQRGCAAFAGLIMALVLSGCALDKARPAPNPYQAGAAKAATSAQMQLYYAQVQDQLLAKGLLRQDKGGSDSRFDDQALASNFLKIALFNEYTHTTDGILQQQSQATLRRWETPLRVALHFGGSVSDAQQARDRASISSYLQRLSGLTGLPIALDQTRPNMLIYLVNEDERRALDPALRKNMPDLGPNDRQAILAMPKSTYCLAVTQTNGRDSIYTRALVVIRAEHPDLLRLSCIHEELAQAMGLPNDSPQGYPSIFNDDGEFALLTRQDEMMLKILYNPELQPGMTPAQARPIVLRLARRLITGID